MLNISGLTEKELEALRARGAIIGEDPTTSSSQATVSTPPPSQNDVQASSALSAQDGPASPADSAES